MFQKLERDLRKLEFTDWLFDCLPIDTYEKEYRKKYKSYYATAKARRDFLREKYGIDIGLRKSAQWERLVDILGGEELAALLCIREGYLSGKAEKKLKEFDEWGDAFDRKKANFLRRYKDLALSPETERLLEKRLGQNVQDKKRQQQKTHAERKKHSELTEKLVEIGKTLGYSVRTEYFEPEGQQRYDVVWFKGPEESPGRIFEVHVHGDVIHTLARLKHANDIWRPVRLCIVLGTERDKGKIQRLARGTFHEIAEKLVILSAKDLEVSTEALRAFL